ncbi:MAG: hypothetical protein R3240_00045 [Gammaproteobacteria bacterium]|nr:hypothetical protein [Gammaproteobacteria bacterium]
MSNMLIEQAVLEGIYESRADVAKLYEVPKTDVDYERLLKSKLWRMNNLYTIVNKDGERIRFRMNFAQHHVYNKSLIHPRLIILKSRQQGISTFWLISFFDDAIFLSDTNVGMMAQGLDEAETLLKRVELAWDALPPSIIDLLQIARTKDNAKEQGYSNGSTIFIRTSFRSTTLQRLHISEFGKIANKYPERAEETKTGTLQAIAPGNTVAIESTAEGDNDFKTMWYNAKDQYKKGQLAPKDFYPVFLSWLDDPDCNLDIYQEATDEQEQYFAKLELETGRILTQSQKNFWISQYRELAEHIFQEYPATDEEAFTAARQGQYYASRYMEFVVKRNREISNLYDKNLDVHVSMDLGVNDDMVLGFWQIHYNAQRKEWEVRQIDEYVNSGEGLDHYVEVMNDRVDSKGYTYGYTILPHDAQVRDLGAVKAKTRVAILKGLGVRRIKVLPRVPVNDGIAAVRKLIPILWVDPKRCPRSRLAYLNYSKEWDPKLKVWKDKPLHNEHSHPADMIRYFALGVIMIQKRNKNEPKRSKQSSVINGLAL